MKIAISSNHPGGLEVLVDPRFGRCAVFTIYDSATGDVDVVPNVAAESFSGAGIQAAQLVTDHGITAVLTGHVGPNAYHALAASGITIYTGVMGTVRNALEQYQAGQLSAVTAATAPAHAGMGGGRGRGRGRGMGRGMGRRGQQG